MNEVPTYVTERLQLRPWRESDIGELMKLLGDPEVTRYLGGPTPYDEEAARAAYERRVRSWAEDGMGLWAMELKETGQLIGWAGLQRIRYEEEILGEVEIGWMVGHDFWGNGYAVEAANRALRFGFEEKSLSRIYALHHPDNVRSERVMEKLGMTPWGVAHDTRDGATSKVRSIKREQWESRVRGVHRPDPHKDADRLVGLLGYDGPAVPSHLLEAEMRHSLLDALVRTWPGGELPAKPKTYEAVCFSNAKARADAFALLASTMATERAQGKALPLLVFTCLRHPEDEQDCLAELSAIAAQEGIWLHADLSARHGMDLPGLARADSIAFDVPAAHGRRRIFATRHPRVLDAAFHRALTGDRRKRVGDRRNRIG